jgi:hypothetical protein
MWDRHLALKGNAKKTKKLLKQEKSDLQVSGSGILTQKSREKKSPLMAKLKLDMRMYRLLRGIYVVFVALPNLMQY